MPANLITTLQKYLPITPQQAEIIRDHAQERIYGKGDFFLQSPKVCTEFGFVVTGVFRYYTIDNDGNEVTAMFIQERDFFTDLESFHQATPSQGFIQAETDAEVLVFNQDSHQQLKSLMEGWNDAIKTISQERLTSQLKFSREIINLDAASAYRLFLAQYPEIADRVPDSHLASYLGMSKFTFSRVKKKIS